MPVQKCELNQVMMVHALLWVSRIMEILTPPCPFEMQMYFLFALQELASTHIKRKI